MLPDRPHSAAAARLNRRMAELGLCSRREADDWIARGWVRVNGRPASVGQRVPPTARIDVDKRATRSQQHLATILMNKPIGVVSSQPERGYPSAAMLIAPRSRWAGDASRRRFSSVLPHHRRRKPRRKGIPCARCPAWRHTGRTRRPAPQRPAKAAPRPCP